MTRPTGPAPRGAELRFPALLWALLHVPVVLLLYAGSLAPALRALQASYRPALWPALFVEALVLALAMFVVPLPLSLWGRLYRYAAPAFSGLATVALAMDARLYASLGFHMNGFFFKALAQPAALREIGIPIREVVILLLQAGAWIAGEALVGGWVLGRLAARRRTWSWVLAFLLLGAAERVYVASVTFFGGQAIFAAGQVLPLQIPVRMNGIWSDLTGRPALGNPLRKVSVDSAMRLPPGVPPASIRFEQKPDVLLLLVESARADYLSPEVMPRLWKRAAQGTIFEHHYTSCPSTFFAVYGLLFGLHAHTFDAALGSGRRPLLFGALAANGYTAKIFAASSVDWMGLKETVFGDVQQELETDWPPELGSDQRDGLIVEHALAAARATPPDRPLFLFLFFDGTHFNYFPTARSTKFLPQWSGGGALKATAEPADRIFNRARNSAYEVDWKIDELLDAYEKVRGRRPLVIVTGDHAEEMREKGHIGHGSSLVNEQIHVPMVMMGDGVPAGKRVEAATVHDDVVPTLFHLLGDRTEPRLYGDGQDMFKVRDDRFVLVSMGWEPRFGAVSRDLKVTFNGMDAGLGGVSVTDPADGPLPDGNQRFSAALPRILQLFQPHPEAPPARAVGPAPARASP